MFLLWIRIWPLHRNAQRFKSFVKPATRRDILLACVGLLHRLTACDKWKYRNILYCCNSQSHWQISIALWTFMLGYCKRQLNLLWIREPQSVLPKRIVEEYFEGVPLQPPAARLVTYSQTPIKVLGCMPATMVVVSCPCNDKQATFSYRRITPATITALADKLPGSLAPLCNYSGSVECLTDDLNIALSAAIDSVAPLVTKKRTLKKPAPWFNAETHSEAKLQDS
ncbi:unnamed protein product [Gadus morhua 'NCC']